MQSFQNGSGETLERGLPDAKATVRSRHEFCDFVIKTHKEQAKLWEVAYKRYSLRISNLREQLKVEEATLDFYSTELEEWKAKLQNVRKEESQVSFTGFLSGRKILLFLPFLC